MNGEPGSRSLIGFIGVALLYSKPFLYFFNQVWNKKLPAATLPEYICSGGVLSIEKKSD